MSKKVKATRISPEQYFSLCTGGLIKDIKALAYTIEHLSDEEMSYHVNKEKNDFSTWLRDVFQEPKLSDTLAEKTDRKDMQIALFKHLVTKRHQK